MTKLELLPAALIAAAMLTTPVVAREHHQNARHLVTRAPDSDAPAARYVDGRICYPAPRVGHLPLSPGITKRLANPRRVIDPSAWSGSSRLPSSQSRLMSVRPALASPRSNKSGRTRGSVLRQDLKPCRFQALFTFRSCQLWLTAPICPARFFRRSNTAPAVLSPPPGRSVAPASDLRPQV